MKRLLLMCLLAGCSRGASAPMTFGAAGPWTEPYGQMNRRGMELALQEINALPERHEHPLAIRFVDDSGDGKVAARVARDFVDSSDVLAVVGHVTSGAMAAAAQVYDGHLAAVATTATSPELTGISPWAFRVISSDSANGADIARFVTRRGRTRAAILYENNSYGRGLADAFRRGFGGQVVSYDPIAANKDQQFEPYISFFKAQHVDVVVVAGTDASGLAFLREVHRQHLDADLVGGDGWSGLSVDTAGSEGIFTGVPFTAQDPRPETQLFVTAFRKKFGLTPDDNAALGYDATRQLYEAARAGASRRQIRNYLAGLTQATAFKGVTGTIYFRPDGDPVGKSVVMTRIEHGQLRVAEASR